MDSTQAYGDVDLKLEKRGSCGNVISLANWNEGAAVLDDESSQAYTPDSVDHYDFTPVLPLNQHSIANNKRYC